MSGKDHVKTVFNSNIQKSFTHIQEVVESMESVWPIFCTTIVEGAA